MELDNVLWREGDNITVKKLWEYLCTYCYLPRLVSENVLNDAIQTGVNSTEYFAIASSFDGSRYIDLKYNQFIGLIERSGYLVKVDVAIKQLEEEEKRCRAEAEARMGNGSSVPAGASDEGGVSVYTPTTDNNDGPLSVNEESVSTGTAPKNKRFFMSADLDTTRINRDVQKYVEEIIQHLTSVDGARVKVSIEVEAESFDGFAQQTVRTISENCRTMRVRDSGFEE
jgi:hypothetical protein